MHVRIVTVIPLSKSLPKDSLDYFSSKEISLGDLVEIPIRKQTHKAIVVAISDAKEQKAELKEAGFQLRPIKKVIGPSPFDAQFLKTLTELQKYYIGNTSQFFSESISQVILDSVESLKKPDFEIKKNEFKKETLVLQKPLNERIGFYKTLIRESFAKGESVRFIVPTIQDANILFETLSKGIQDYSFLIHSKKNQKQIIESWNTIVSKDHPICIIHTPQFLCIPRHDTGVIILEQENSHHFQSNKRPYIDGRILTELFARIHNTKLIMSDTLLRTETLVRQQNQELGTVDNLFFRIDSPAEHIVVDMRKEEHKGEILSSEVAKQIAETYRQGKKILLFALRPGLATTTICNDCGTTQTYKGSPLTLHSNPDTGERFFKSKKYNKEFRTNVVCHNCSSWNLQALGIGTETVESLVTKNNQNLTVFRIDQNQNHTPKQIKTTLEKFEKHEGGAILITSQIGIPYLSQNISLSCIVSLDSLFNIPQFNMYEKITHIIMDISSKTTETCFLQTRFADQKITSILQSKKLFDFFEYDMEERKFWEYPPFSTIIKMSYEGPKKEVSLIENYLKKTFEGYEFYTYHSRGTSETKTLTHVIIKVPAKFWPFPWEKGTQEETKKLKEKLDIFPPSWSIAINPQNIL